MSLNTIDSFINEGFKIVRDGKEITLTHSEMAEFRYMDRAHTGRCSLEYVLGDEDFCIPEDWKQSLLENEEICEDVTQNFEEVLYEDSGELEYDVVCSKVKEYMIEQLLNPSKHDFFVNFEQGKLSKDGDFYSMALTDTLELRITVMNEKDDYKVCVLQLVNEGQLVNVSPRYPYPFINNKNFLWDEFGTFLYKNLESVVRSLDEKEQTQKSNDIER